MTIKKKRPLVLLKFDPSHV